MLGRRLPPREARGRAPRRLAASSRRSASFVEGGERADTDLTAPQLPRLPGKIERAAEHPIEHLGRQPPRVGVLSAGVVRADEGRHAGQVGHEGPPVFERRPRPGIDAALPHEPPVGLRRDPSERDHDPRAPKRRDLGLEVRRAVGDLLGRRPVGGWRAAHGGQDVRVAKLQAVIGSLRGGEAGEAAGVHGPHQEIARPVAREDAPGAVGAVSGGGQPEDEHAGGGIAKARNRPAPVRLGAVRRFLFARDPLTVLAQSRTPPATDDTVVDQGKGRRFCRVPCRRPCRALTHGQRWKRTGWLPIVVAARRAPCHSRRLQCALQTPRLPVQVLRTRHQARRTVCQRPTTNDDTVRSQRIPPWSASACWWA